jgi:histone H3/H4
MKVIAPVRLKRKRAPESTPAESTAAESTAAESTAVESTPAESTAAPESTAATRGILRKSAVRRFLKREFEFPLQVREAFFTAIEAKIAEDLRRSVARALESKRSTLMTPDA